MVRPLKAFGLPNCLRDFHRNGRGQPLVYRSLEEELCRKYWSNPRRLRRTSFRSTARTTSSFTLATRVRRRTSTAPPSAFGWRRIAVPRPAPATARRYVLVQDKIRFVFTTPLQPDHAIADTCPAARRWRARYRTVGGRRRGGVARDHQRGARSVREPETLRDSTGEVRIAAIGIYGDTIHSFRRTRAITREPSCPDSRP